MKPPDFGKNSTTFGELKNVHEIRRLRTQGARERDRQARHENGHRRWKLMDDQAEIELSEDWYDSIFEEV